MARYSMLAIPLCSILLIAGCSGQMVRLSETEHIRPINGVSDLEDVREAVLDGIENAGWVVESEGSGIIQATYRIRTHTVHVNVFFTSRTYDIRYSSSISMKMYCTEYDKQSLYFQVSGNEFCPGNSPPKYLNANYKIWVDSLVSAIEKSLANK